jgi:hypothetical protein
MVSPLLHVIWSHPVRCDWVMACPGLLVVRVFWGICTLWVRADFAFFFFFFFFGTGFHQIVFSLAHLAERAN